MATTGRNTNISICKGIAIILMVMGHTEGPQLLINFIYLFHMPIFFITAGYFFSKKYLNDPWTFCKKRFKGLYIPFVKWSLFFLIIHNLLFKVGILNEQFGNWENGVTYPYNWQAFIQRVFSVFFSMGGYDEFLTGAFWFFRALFVTSIVFLVLYLLLHNRKHWLNETTVPLIICALALIVALLKIYYGLKIVTVVQGGIRECWGVFFFSFGVLYRKYQDKFREHWAQTIVFFVLLCAGSYLKFHGMNLTPKLYDVATLPMTGIIGFLMVHSIATSIDHRENIIKRFLVYCGDNTLCIFVFHISAFKLVSLLKIWWYNLEWGQIGCHMVIHFNSTTDVFFIIYTIVGVAVPLLWYWGYMKLKHNIKARRAAAVQAE